MMATSAATSAVLTSLTCTVHVDHTRLQAVRHAWSVQMPAQLHTRHLRCCQSWKYFSWSYAKGRPLRPAAASVDGGGGLAGGASVAPAGLGEPAAAAAAVSCCGRVSLSSTSARLQGVDGSVPPKLAARVGDAGSQSSAHTSLSAHPLPQCACLCPCCLVGLSAYGDHLVLVIAGCAEIVCAPSDGLL